MPAVQEELNSRLDAKALLNGLAALKRGDFSARLPLEWTGLAGKIAETFNDMAERHERMAGELECVSRVVGREGRINERAHLDGAQGAWAASISSVNALVRDLVYPTSETARWATR